MNVSRNILSHLRSPGYSAASQSRSFSSLPRPYHFHVGACWAGKPSDPHIPRLRTTPFPPDSEIGKWRDHTLSKHISPVGNHVGEDFFYVQDMRNQSGVSLGIADGVGGWVDAGVDPSLFSQALMFHAHRYSKFAWAGEPEIDPTQDYEEREEVEGWELTPSECLENSFHGVLRERAVIAGSSTACIMTLNASSGLLRAANIGDSGFLIIRSSNVIYQQPIQTHFFNCPKQLTKMPISRPRFSRACVDSPKSADLFETRLRDGDIVIAYTDGLSDNVWPEELISICSRIAHQHAVSESLKTRSSGSDEQQDSEDLLVQTMAERIVDYARLCMSHKLRQSPFERAAAREGMYFRGGVSEIPLLCRGGGVY
ncbi:protein serine/threonine phosphatase 2C [Sparassis latifolia]